MKLRVVVREDAHFSPVKVVDVEDEEGSGGSVKEWVAGAIGLDGVRIRRVLASSGGESAAEGWEEAADVDEWDELEDGDWVFVELAVKADGVSEALQAMVSESSASLDECGTCLAALHSVLEDGFLHEKELKVEGEIKKLFLKFPTALRVLLLAGYQKSEVEAEVLVPPKDRSQLRSALHSLQHIQLQLRDLRSTIRSSVPASAEPDSLAGRVGSVVRGVVEADEGVGIARLRAALFEIRKRAIRAEEGGGGGVEVVEVGGEREEKGKEGGGGGEGGEGGDVGDVEDVEDTAHDPDPKTAAEWAHLAQLMEERSRRIRLSKESLAAERIEKVLKVHDDTAPTASRKPCRIRIIQLPSRTPLTLRCSPFLTCRAMHEAISHLTHTPTSAIQLTLPTTARKRALLFPSPYSLDSVSNPIVITQKPHPLDAYTLAELGMWPVGTIRVKKKHIVEK